MIVRKDFWIVLLLSFVTCGIYYWVYIYQVTRDINTMAGEDGRGTDPAMVILLSIVTCGFYHYYWLYQYGNRMQDLGRANNIRVEESGTTYLLWEILGILICGLGTWVGVYLFVKNFNVLADGYNRNSTVYPQY